MERTTPSLALKLRIMPEGHELTDVRTASTKQQDYAQQAVERAREKLSRYLDRAVEIITELAETSENDRVRLAAAESIADRAGLGKSSTTKVEVSDSEHEAARREAEDVMRRLQANQEALSKGRTEVSLDALVVHEGETEPAAN